MPMVTVQWLEGRTPQQKAQLAGALTRAFTEVAQVPPEQVWIVFDDVKRSDWAMGGKLVEPKS
jgi:4-oxalocrotonate tautomerase